MEAWTQNYFAVSILLYNDNMMKKDKVKNSAALEDKERKYWAVHDSADRLNWKKAKKTVFPNLKTVHIMVGPRKKSNENTK